MRAESPPAPAGDPDAQPKRFLAVVSIALTIVMIALALLPAERIRIDRVLITIEQPWNSNPRCSVKSFDHEGELTFSLQILSGDPVYLNVTSVDSGRILSALGNSYFSGSIPVSPPSEQIAFCLSHIGPPDPTVHGAVTVDGNLSWHEWAPIL
jgi:hypothetical protein